MLQETRRSYRELFYTAPIGEAVSGAIMFKETLYQSATDGTPFVDCLTRQGVLPGIKVRRHGRAGLAGGGPQGRGALPAGMGALPARLGTQMESASY